MQTKNKGIIVYYAFGTVHLHNLKRIAASMPDWTFQILYEPYSAIKIPELEKLPFENFPFTHYQVPAAIKAEKVRAIIFSVIHLRAAPLNLLKYGLDHGIPTIAIEEANQMAMNKYLLNAHRNYIYPADHILAASEYERREMVDLGVPSRRVTVTGWPFYSGPDGKIDPLKQRSAKINLGVDPNKPLAALTFSAVGFADETLDSVKKQLCLAAKGLPPEYQLAVKPHPINKKDEMQPFIKKHAPQATFVDGTMPIQVLLNAADILLNRGVSQVIIEALYQEIPVIILPTGIKSPFLDHLTEFFAGEPEELTKAVKRLEREKEPMKFFNELRKLHAPFPPEVSCKQTCKRIEEIAGQGITDPEPAKQWLEVGLYQAFRVNRRQALNSLASNCLDREKKTKEALKQLIKFKATRSQLEELKKWTAGSFKEQALRSLWIDQLSHNNAAVTDSDLDWLQGFPPTMCFSYFYHHTMLWFDLLLHAGLKQEILESANRLRNDYGYIPEIKQIVRGVELFRKGGLGRLKYETWKLYKQTKAYLRRFPRLTQLANRIG